jgi:dihydrofolate synthase/folylpolyglutamate synthase
MTYIETLSYLYSCTPAFHLVGSPAYKPGLERSIALDDAMGNPHRTFQSIHIAGTNGKGSVAHLLAAVLREAKYKVGLYTSPHVSDFCERIRVNGRKIPSRYVVDLVMRFWKLFEAVRASFFEVTTAMAFEFFYHKGIDIAVVETGLGGRLDSTNIIHPMMSIITNISMDHKQYLGNTLTDIATEKAGIIKARVPVIIGDAEPEEVYNVFAEKAMETLSPLYCAQQEQRLMSVKQPRGSSKMEFHTPEFGRFTCELEGSFQRQNVQTVLTALHHLKKQHIRIPQSVVGRGFGNVMTLTGLTGRWQTLQTSPTVICDIGHNPAAWTYLSQLLKLKACAYIHTYMIIGLSNDKDVDGILSLLPTDARYYFTQVASGRALPAQTLAEKARQYGLNSSSHDTVANAVKTALDSAVSNDLIFIGGSAFIVAEALPLFENRTANENKIKPWRASHNKKAE